MLKTPKYMVPIFACSLVALLASSAVPTAANVIFPLSGKGVQRGATIKGDRAAPRKAPTHSKGVVAIHNPNGPLRGPELRESHAGKLQGVAKQGDKGTPKRAPTFTVQRR
jgi:hypothetical protein